MHFPPGSVGTVHKREVRCTWDREAATSQNQDFAELLENWKRWGRLPFSYNKQHSCFQFYRVWNFVCTSLTDSWFNYTEQVQKLQNIIASRASQYSHDAKRKEREAAKLKERLSQLLVDRKDKKLGKNADLWRVYIYISVSYLWWIHGIQHLHIFFWIFILLPFFKLLMYWTVWDGQMEKGATGRLQKQRPGIMKGTLSQNL